MDLLPGFGDYFASLTSEGRAQVWGFTLPYTANRKASAKETLRPRCEQELKLLADRLDQGITNRMQEEYDTQRRCKLYGLPQEFAALTEPLIELIERVFLDSKFDTTQLHNTLRGVYFTSAAQAHANAIADQLSPLQRFWRALRHDPTLAQKTSQQANTVAPTGNRSYFLHDLLTRLVFPEAHLVQPNLHWELRFKLLRLIGHLLAIVIFIWLLSSLRVSFANNSDYLTAVDQKTTALSTMINAMKKNPSTEKVPEVLTAARELAVYQGLDPADPPNSYRYGLYSVPPVVEGAVETYDQLLDRLLLPHIVRRVESELSSAVSRQDTKAAYDALRVYLLLNLDATHQNKFDAMEIRQWVLKDGETSDGAAVFGGQASILAHVEQLFSGHRIVHSPFVKNDALIRTARTYLDGRTGNERIYECAKASMAEEAPEDFTLARAVGAQAGNSFVRASGAPLDSGVPGLFTYDGYHDLFNKRFAEFVAQAYSDDEWVMGRESAATQKKTAERVAQLRQRAGLGNDPLVLEIRRMYLTEYAERWQAFLEDIHSVNSTGADSSASLAFDLLTLRTFAAPDSPLGRLAKAVEQETTLVLPPDPKEKEKILAEQAERRLSGRTRQLVKTAKLLNSSSTEEVLEKTLVDNRFAALREVVTGQSDNQSSTSAGIKPLHLDAILMMLNEYYNQLMMADNALASNNLPPTGDAGLKLRLEAAKLPAPFKNILLDLTTQGSRKVNLAIGEVLTNQMETTVGSGCRYIIDGKYPFAASTQEVDPEDFARVFATGGLLDNFFNQHLVSQVDITADPWRYKQPEDGATSVQGPSLSAFQRAKQIRETFFTDPGARKMSWSMDIKVIELDPNITDLIIDIDGQILRYIHGPVTPLRITWPGPRNGSMAEITANPRVRQDTSTILTNGPWALFRLLDRGRAINSVSSNRQLVEYHFDGRRVLLEISTSSQFNPLTSTLLKNFSCPERAS